MFEDVLPAWASYCTDSKCTVRAVTAREELRWEKQLVSRADFFTLKFVWFKVGPVIFY